MAETKLSCIGSNRAYVTNTTTWIYMKKLVDSITISKLANARAECHKAIAHVGAANYVEREAEANEWVDKAFNSIKEGH